MGWESMALPERRRFQPRETETGGSRPVVGVAAAVVEAGEVVMGVVRW